MRDTRHKEVAAVLKSMMSKVGWDVWQGESTGWVRGRPDLRPLDVVYRRDPKEGLKGFDLAIADSTRLTMLPKGKQYFGRGGATERMAARKRSDLAHLIKTYGPLKKEVSFTPVVFDATSGRGKEAEELFRELVREANRNGYQAPTEDWSWTAQSFGAYWSQRLSHVISKYSAISVLTAVRKVNASKWN